MIYPPPNQDRRDLFTQLRIRLVRETDLPALEWEGEYAHFRKIYQNSFYRQQQGKGLMWLVELPANNIIGQVFIQFITDQRSLADGKNRAYLYSFRIKPLYRNLGIGAKLLQTVILDLHSRGFHQVTLNVAKDNPRAIQFYKQHGFRVISEDPGDWSYPDHNGVWQDVHEPSWRMIKYF